MVNKNIEEELKNNYDSHELFINQNKEDLINLKKDLMRRHNETIVELNKEDFIDYEEIILQNNNSKEIWEQVVSRIIMDKIYHRFYNVEIPNEPLNRDKTFNYIRYANTRSDRFHIIINYNNPYLYEEILNYIDDTTPFITMIYLPECFNTFHSIEINNNKYNIWELYDYNLFDNFQEKITSSDIRKRVNLKKVKDR